MRSYYWPGIFLFCGCLCAQQPALPPLTAELRTQLWADRSFWSTSVLYNVIIPPAYGLLADTPRDWDQGVSGFGRRAASSFGRNVVQQSVKAGVSAALKNEVRYVPSRSKNVWARISNAVTADLVTYNSSGGRTFNAGALSGVAVAEATANLWFPDRYRTASQTFGRIGLVLAYDCASNLFREFTPELKRFIPFRKH